MASLSASQFLTRAVPRALSLRASSMKLATTSTKQCYGATRCYSSLKAPINFSTSSSQVCFASRLRLQSQTCSFSTRASHNAPRKTMEQLKARNSTGPFSWKAGVLFIATGGAMILYFKSEKARLEREHIAQLTKGTGKPKVGGPFVLKDLKGQTFTEENLKGKYSFVYFGFTHCPDICPDELDKMAEIIDKVKEKAGHVMRPVFITCDPVRDTPEVLKEYLQEFHTDLIGLTGTYHQVKDVCKKYRVYFSTPENVKPDEDYLVDHSIYFYLMGECIQKLVIAWVFADDRTDPEGDFVECIGRNDTPESASELILSHINDWKRAKKPLDTTPEPAN
ncbi:hypothetical protein KEM56_007792 [Ascosphaera pollenicola]|nr:hypothetical protein KEM56_007792 [Ascosphaera pollenicola]